MAERLKFGELNSENQHERMNSKYRIMGIRNLPLELLTKAQKKMQVMINSKGIGNPKL